MQVVMLNGPPKSGKDTIADALVQAVGAMWAVNYKLSSVLKATARTMFNLSDTQYNALERPENKDKKGTAKSYGVLTNRSWREVLISLSEDYIKPTYGEDFFGYTTAKALNTFSRSGYSHVFISDSGFREEAETLVTMCPTCNFTLVRLHRDGTDFNNDSRSYWPNQTHVETHAVPLMNEIAVFNEGTVDQAVRDIISRLERM
tara:strand:+ start:34 stop:642 length:609 start_codon:yes stop_codon:yes gene_type:complete